MIDIDIQVLVQALELNPLGTIIVNARDPQRPIVYVNPAFETLTGFDSGELLGRAWRVLAAGSKDDTDWPDADQLPDLPVPRTTAKLRCPAAIANRYSALSAMPECICASLKGGMRLRVS